VFGVRKIDIDARWYLCFKCNNMTGTLVILSKSRCHKNSCKCSWEHSDSFESSWWCSFTWWYKMCVKLLDYISLKVT